jgi:DMSO reductase anchor subunit
VKPAWSVILFTTLTGAGQGLFLAVFAVDLLLGFEIIFSLTATAVSLALLGAGLIASFFHLGHPERAWRTAAMWRASWLSREVIALPLFMVLVSSYLFFLVTENRNAALVAGIAAGIVCVALFVCTGMIYACLKFLQEWHSPLTLVNFAALGSASGLTAAAALAAWLHPALLRPLVAAALVMGAGAYLLRLASLARNARLRPKSTLASALGIRHPKIVQIAQGAMGGSFNTREFFHGRPREVVRAVRWSFLGLGFPLPALLLILGESSKGMLVMAFLTQYAGLLAERWYFFAEARHPQNLYYQAIA